MLPSPTGAWLGPRLAAALTLALALHPFACNPSVPEPCGGRCGPGTACVEDRCEALPGTEPAAAEPPAKKGKRGKRGKRGAGAGPGEPGQPAAGETAADASDEPLPPFVAVDDRKIPEFSAAEPQALDMKAGSERLSEAVLDQHFARVNPAIVACVTTASRYGELGSGSLKFKLRILPTGKVESVSVTAPASLKVWGIIPCARKAVFEHRFPTFDGPAIAVNFGVDVD